MMRRHQIRVVIHGNGILAKAARRLNTHKHIAELQPGDHEGAVVSVDRPWRSSPRLLERCAYGHWPALEPLLVGGGAHLSNRLVQLLLSKKFLVIRPTGDEGLYETIAVRWERISAEVIARLL